MWIISSVENIQKQVFCICYTILFYNTKIKVLLNLNSEVNSISFALTNKLNFST